MILTLLKKWKFWLPLLVWIGSLFPQAAFAQGGTCNFDFLNQSNPLRDDYSYKSNLFAAVPFYHQDVPVNLVNSVTASVYGDPYYNYDDVFFDGDGDYLFFPQLSDSLISEFTLILWAQPSLKKKAIPLSLRQSLAASPSGIFYFYDEHFYINFLNDSNFYNQNYVVELYKTKQFAVVQKSGTVKLYVDGYLISSSSRNYSTYKSFQLGSSEYRANDFNGFIYEFLGYDVALDPSDFPSLKSSSVYDCTFLTPTPAPTFTPTSTPTPTPTPGPTLIPGSCTDADSCAPLIYQNTNQQLVYSQEILNRLDMSNNALSVLHNDILGLNTTLSNFQSTTSSQLNQLHADMTSIDTKLQALIVISNALPPHVTESISTSSGLIEYKSYATDSSAVSSIRQSVINLNWTVFLVALIIVSAIALR